MTPEQRKQRARDRLRTELIQTAAVAVAALEDLIFESAGDSEQQTIEILGHVREERRRQDAKWGPQHHNMFVWLSILGEEFGEVCKASLEIPAYDTTEEKS